VERLDRQIVHCLRYDGRASDRRIADVLAVSEQTVARRYRALEEAGAVRVRVLPAPDQQVWFVRIRCRPDAAGTLAEALAARDDVSWVSVTSGGAEIVCVARGDPDRAHGSVLHRLPRTTQVLTFDASAVMHAYPGRGAGWLAVDDPLTPDQIARLPDAHGRGRPGRIRPDDAPLLSALARDGRAGVVALARATGWRPSRVSARLDELLRAGAVRVEVDLAPEMFGFHAPAYLWLAVAPADLEPVGEALSREPETGFAAAVTGPANLLVAVTCHTLDDLYTFVGTRVGALPAVQRVEVVPVLQRLKQAGARVRDDRLARAG